MTIGAYIVLGIIAIVGLGITIYCWNEIDTSAGIFSLLVSAGIIIALFFAMRWWYGSTASGSRALKNQKSNLQNGLERTVEVYNINGEKVWDYTGKMDLTYDSDGSIYFDDANTGKRTIVYNPTGITIVKEK